MTNLYLSYTIIFSHILNNIFITKNCYLEFFSDLPQLFFFLNSYSFKVQVTVLLRIHLETILCTYI